MCMETLEDFWYLCGADAWLFSTRFEVTFPVQQDILQVSAAISFSMSVFLCISYHFLVLPSGYAERHLSTHMRFRLLHGSQEESLFH